MVKVSRFAAKKNDIRTAVRNTQCRTTPTLCIHAGTCGLVQLTLVCQRKQAAGGILEAPFHPDLAQRNPVFQLAAGISNPAL